MFNVYPQPVAASKLVGKLNTAGPQLLAAASVTTPSNSTSPSSWVQVTASTGAEYYLVSAGLVATGGSLLTGSMPLILDIGIGSSGSETIIASCAITGLYYTGSGNAPMGWCPLQPALRISASTRVAVRLTTAASQGTTASCAIRIGYVPVANVEGN
jgi:hypothetical protein